jgi:competence protein ComEC
MNQRHHLFYLRVLIPYLAGVLLGFRGVIEGLKGAFVLFLFAMVLVSFYFWMKGYKRIVYDALYGAALMLLFVALGLFRQYVHNELHANNHFSNSITDSSIFLVKLKEEPLEKGKYIRFNVQVLEKYTHRKLEVKVSGSCMVYLRKPITQNLSIGDYIFISSKEISLVLPPKNPGEFNYSQFLSYKNIYFQSFPSFWAHAGYYNNSLFRLSGEVRNKLRKRLAMLIADDSKTGFAEALLVGYKHNLTSEISSSFAKSGTLHVLAVSGLHAGIIFFILSFLFKPFERLGAWGVVAKALLVILGMWFYAFITGLTPSVTRASFMFSLMQLALVVGRKPKVFNNIFASAFFMLLYDPLLIMSVGFQLSYAAVLGIVYFHQKISYWYVPSNKIIGYFWSLLAVSLAAQIATFPISVFYFHQFPTYFLIANLAIIPGIFATMVSLIALLVLGLFPFLLPALIWLVKTLVEVILGIAQYIEKLPHASINSLHLSFFELFLLYFLIIVFGFLLYNKTKVMLHLLLISYCLLFVSFNVKTYSQQRQSKVLVHVIKNQQVVSVIHGREAFLIANPVLVRDTAALQYGLSTYFAMCGVQNVHYIDWLSTYTTKGILLDKGSLSLGALHLKPKGKSLLFYNSHLNATRVFVQSEKDFRAFASKGVGDITLLKSAIELSF